MVIIAGKRAVFVAAAAAVLAFLIFRIGSPSLNIRASVSKTDVLIGDSLKYTLVITARSGTVVERPDIRAHLADFTFRDLKTSVEDFFRRRVYRYVCIFSRNDPGDYTIGPMKVRYREKGETGWREKKTRAFNITVRGVLPEQAGGGKIRMESGIAGAKGPIRSDGDDSGRDLDVGVSYRIKDAGGPKSVKAPLDIVFMALMGLAAAAFFAVLVSFIYDKVFRRKVPPMPPDAVALQKLKALENAGRPHPEGPREFCRAVSSALKEYLRARFGMEPLEKTATEFMSELDLIPGVDDGCKEKVREVLALCDLVKYAEYGSSPEELGVCLAHARDVIIKTRAEPKVTP